MGKLTVVEMCDRRAPSFVRIAASFAAKLALEAGARVIKVEPPSGDPVRSLGPFLDCPTGTDRSALFQFLNAAKTSYVASTDRLDDSRTYDLVNQADVVIAGCDGMMREEPWPGQLQDAAWRSWVSIRPYAVDSPHVGTPSSELTVLAIGGLLQMVGEPDREPLRLAGHQGAYSAGLAGYLAMNAALLCPRHRVRAAVAVVDVVKWINWKARLPGSPTSRQGADAEWQVVEAADGHVALVFQAADWPQLRSLVGDVRLDEPQFATAALRKRHRAELMTLLREWSVTLRKARLFELAQERRIPIGPVLSPSELLEDPQYIERRVVSRVIHPSLGVLPMPRAPVLVDGLTVADRVSPAYDSNDREGLDCDE